VLGIRSLGLEWSYDEVGRLVDDAVASGRFDLDALWAIPAGGDLFSGDGRFTAGHVRVLEHLLQAGELTRVVPFDRLDRQPPLEDDREVSMAERILEHVRLGERMLAVTGSFHASRESSDRVEPMFVHLERALPGVANGVLELPDGELGHRADVRFRLPFATPAVVPAK
jgi:hypothetical protein